MKQTFRIEGMTCEGCENTIKKSLKSISGIENVEVNRGAKQLSITTNKQFSLKDIQDSIPSKYKVLPTKLSNTEHKRTEDDTSKLSQLKPLFLILGYILVSSILLHYEDWNIQAMMLDFMGLFFLVFSFFKMLDIKGFASTFMMYDPIAKRHYSYGYIYPFLETGLALMIFFRWNITMALILTVIILGFTTIGVIRVLMDKRPIKCACLGTALNLPMTEATLTENVVMLFMALVMLLA